MDDRSDRTPSDSLEQVIQLWWDMVFKDWNGVSNLYQSVHITVKELVPMVVPCGVWGPVWQEKTVLSM